jgi:hypothetical protein
MQAHPKIQAAQCGKTIVEVAALQIDEGPRHNKVKICNKRESKYKEATISKVI